MIVSIVVARATNGVIGKDGGLPWRIPEDMKHFRRVTMGKPVIMGRRTWESIGKPLDGRRNIVVTRGAVEGVETARSIDEALERLTGEPEVALIGGAKIYEAGLGRADVVHLTEVHGEPEGDTVMPGFDPAVWRETERDDREGYSFVTLERTFLSSS